MKSKIFFFAILALITFIAIAFWVWSKNSYSKEVLKLEIIAPESAEVGEEIKYLVRIKNNGDVRLDEPRLVFEFPSYSIPKEGELLRVVKEKEDFDGAIYPGQEKVFEFKAQLFGGEGEVKEATALLSYKPKNLTAKYISKTSAITIIRNVPISFDFDLRSEIDAGRSFNFSINYFSSLEYPLNDLSIKATYPAGFKFIESDPRGIADNEWQIPVLNKAEGGRIDIKGILNGETGEKKVFKAQLGIWIGTDFVVLKEISKSVEIIEPSLYIDQFINGVRNYIAKPGDLLHYEIIFRNIGDRIFQDLFLVVKLRGRLFDLSSIKTENGEVALGDDSIIWTGEKVSELKFLEPGSQGQVEFWVKLKEDEENVQTPKIENEILLSQSKRKFVTKVGTKLTLTQEVFIDDEIFGSEGPLPPEVGKESYFTVIWKVTNSFNPLKDVKVKAILPPEVELTGEMMPQDLTFDPKTREILWEIEEVAPHQGKDKPLMIAFQIKFKPKASQKGKPAVLVGEATINGIDTWINQEVETTAPELKTTFFGEDKGIIK
ncbi:hypothetical protein J7L09_01145 [bacterium]|nr:hypothetical protein [bacterium]